MWKNVFFKGIISGIWVYFLIPPFLFLNFSFLVISSNSGVRKFPLFPLYIRSSVIKYFIFNKSIYRVDAVLGNMSWTRHRWSLSSNSPAAAAAKSLSCVWLCATLLTVAHQASLSVGFSRQKYCSGLRFPSPGDLSDLGIETVSLMSPALAGCTLPQVPPGKPTLLYNLI